MKLLSAVVTTVSVIGVAAAGNAQVPQYPPVVDRHFNIDLFEQPAIGSPRLIGMAGAINSVAEGAAGLYTNPASAAVRPETRSDKLAWSVYFNTYVPASGQDMNNNGQPTTSLRLSLLGAAGLLVQYGPWGLSVDGGYTAHEIAPQAGGGLGVRSLIAHVTLARTLADDSLAAGVGARLGALNVYTLDGAQTLFTRAGASAEAGVLWKPRGRSFRGALGGALPVYTGALSYDCDPNDCYGYILPEDAVVPWDVVVGTAWRIGPTPWNQRIDSDYRDERELTVAVDVSFMGAVENGYGMEAFANRQLQPSGRHVSVTPRLGLESELVPAWLRLRAGTYYEASRFADQRARAHLTGGAEVRLFAFHLLHHERRVAISFAGDVARRYHNVGLSVGFWN